MRNENISGETIVKKRQQKIYIILGMSLIMGAVMGFQYGRYQSLPPLWLVLGMTVVILLLTGYYYTLRDEYQKMRDYKHMALGVFLAIGIMFPWYFAGLKGLLPMPHILATFIIICIPTFVMTIISWFQNNDESQAL